MLARWHTATAIAALAALGGFGCEDLPPPLPGEAPPPCDLARSYYLIDGIDTSLGERGDPAIDVDRDGTPDGNFNRFRRLLDEVNNLASYSFERAVDGGAFAWVLELGTCGEVDHARVTLCQGILEGDPLAAEPVVSVSCSGIAAVGAEESGNVRTYEGRSSIPISALFDSEADTASTAWFDAESVSLEAAVGPDGTIEGLLGFGAPTVGLIDVTSGALSRSITEAIATDPGCPDDCQLDPQSLLELQHDVNRDGTVTIDEVSQRHPALISPYDSDLDLMALYEGAQVYWPVHDGRVDSVSFAARFHARLATAP